jgi:hypothetical protein
MLRSLSVVSLLTIFVGGSACTSMLGIDGKYEPDLSPGDGGATTDFGNGGGPGSGAADNASGGAGGAGGTTPVPTGGASATGGVPPRPTGAAPEGGTCMPSDCGAMEKCCPALSAVCLPQGPIIGCGASSCDPCPPPPDNGIDICKQGACAIRCNEAFVEQDGKCVPMGAGGAGGGTGAGGAMATSGGTGTGGAACVPTKCPPCNIAGPLQCCRNNGTCGCTWWDPAHVCY